MSEWQDQLDATLAWLLEPAEPAVRHLALRDLLRRPADNPELCAARAAAHAGGPIAAILAAMDPAGFWVKPGHGYGPKYRSGVWSLIALAQAGASAAADERVARACDYMLENGLRAGTLFTATQAPSGNIDCLQGNLIAALLDLGYDDPRLEPAVEWMARSVTGEGVAPQTDKRAERRYYAYNCGPGFACGANDKQPCAWAAVKVLAGFARWPTERRTPLIDAAIQRGVDFLFSVEPTTAEWPHPYAAKPSGDWHKFGFPVFYVTDLLQVAEVLVRWATEADQRLAGTLELIRSKADAGGRWALEYNYAGKTWGGWGAKRPAQQVGHPAGTAGAGISPPHPGPSPTSGGGVRN